MAWHQILCLKILFFVEKIGQNERPSPPKKKTTKKGVPSEGEGYVEKTVESEEHPLPGWPTRCRRRQTNCILVHSSCQTHSASCVSVQDRSEWILVLLLGHPMYEVTKSPSHLQWIQKKHPNRESSVSAQCSFKGDGAAATSPCCSCSRLHCSCFMA